MRFPRCRNLVLLALLPLVSAALQAQAEFPGHLRVLVRSGGRSLEDAVVSAGRDTVRTGPDGLATLTIDTALTKVVVNKLGFEPDSVSVYLSPRADTTLTVTLTPLAIALAPIMVSVARTEQRIEDVPVRVEILTGEDIGEKSAMRPGDLTQMVVEIPGIRVPPISPGAGGASMRIQGFRAQYTEILTDGLPLATSSNAGLSLVQVAPLDLAQVEVVKAGASALYGSSALGGVVNFVSRHPPSSGQRPTRELNFSESSYQETDAVSFSGAPLARDWGYTLLAAVHRAPILDPDNDIWADAAGSRRLSLRPRVFWTAANGSRGLITAGFARDLRLSGTFPGRTLPGDGEFSDSLRTSTRDVGATLHLTAPNAVVLDLHLSTQLSSLDRSLGGQAQRDQSANSGIDAAATLNRGRLSLLSGAALRREANRSYEVAGFDYEFYTASLFAQATTEISSTFSASATGRCEHHSRYGRACVPLVALLARSNGGWNARLSGALGVHAPSPFIEETSITGFARLKPFSGPDQSALAFERARQATLDVGRHRGPFDVNVSLYAADIFHPVGVRDLSSGAYAQELVAAPGPTRLRGVDLFAVYTGDPFAVTAFYGFLRGREVDLDSTAMLRYRDVPLSPAHRAGLDIALDLEETGSRVAVEAYYNGRQSLANDPYRRTSRPYTTMEALATQNIGRVQAYLSAENLTNVVQTHYDPLLLPAQSPSGRWTTDAWAPLSGRMFRAGARISY